MVEFPAGCTAEQMSVITIDRGKDTRRPSRVLILAETLKLNRDPISVISVLHGILVPRIARRRLMEKWIDVAMPQNEMSMKLDISDLSPCHASLPLQKRSQGRKLSTSFAHAH